MPQHYRMTAHAGSFQRDAVVTDDQIKGTGANVDDWKRLGVIKETEAPTTTGVPEGDPDHPISDAENKHLIEEAIRTENARRPTPMGLQEQQALAKRITDRNNRGRARADAEGAAQAAAGPKPATTTTPLPPPPAAKR